MTNLSQLVRSRLARQQRPLDEHPGADLLSGFAEQALSASERAALMAHLERCPECREVLALSVPASEALLSRSKKPVNTWHLWRWSATAALACLILAVVLEPRLPDAASPHLTPVPTMAAVGPKPREHEPTLPPALLQAKKAAPSRANHVPRKTPVKVLQPPPMAIERPLAPPPPEAAALSPHRLQFQSLGKNPVSRFVDAAILSPTGNSVWKIEEDGTLLKSRDAKTWMPVPLEGRAKLYTLSASGPDIWVGGAEGALFHSPDDGMHWTQVRVQDGNGARLTDAITSISIKTSAGNEKPMELVINLRSIWSSVDGGRTWRQQNAP